MAFSEIIKKEVRQKAAYQCCCCRNFGIEVHHIIPSENQGQDTIDNAAPLCPNCHTDFGNNLKKRKVIKEMRDWWYKKVDNMFNTQPSSMRLLQKIGKQVEEIKNTYSQDVPKLKRLLKEYINQTINNITPNNASSAASEVVSATRIADKVHANFQCKKCGTAIGLLIGS